MTRAGSPVEAAPVLSSSSNPDGCCHHRYRQQASRRFQRASTAEVEFSTEFAVSLCLYSLSCHILMMFQEARNSLDPYLSAQELFDRGQVEGNEDTFSDVFKKDFIEAAGMKARRKMRRMRIDPYLDAILRRGLH